MMLQRHKLMDRWADLKLLRQPRLEHWRDITNYLIPYGGRYLASSRDKQVNRYQDIIDEAGTNALEVLESGMMALRTSPARPWFKFLTADPSLNERPEVKKWFRKAEEVTRLVHRKSNTNLALPTIYSETGAFGTAATIMVEDLDTVIHHHILTAGEYAIAADSRGRVDTLYREFEMSVVAVVGEFGLENCSPTVRNLYTSNNWHAPVVVIHAIEPRPIKEREYGNRTAKHMPWKSCYFEAATDDDRYLRESGFETFPCLVPRWRVTGGDTWGEGPGTKALGSVRELQISQIRKAEVIDHLTKPPVQVPASLRDMDRDLLPGGTIPYDQNTPQGGVRAAFEIQARVGELLESIQDVRRRIDRSFFVNLFQPVTAISDTTQRTAMEIMQRREEMLTVLGPVTQRMERELDAPLLEFTFERIIREGLLPPPPQELSGAELDVEFLGPLAQALKAVDAEQVDRVVMHLGQLAALKPEVLDKYDADKDMERYADMLGVDPNLIVAGDKVAMIRRARAEAESAMAQNEMMATQAKTARDMAAADTSGQNALTDTMEQFTGY